MANYNAENERIKRKYPTYLKAAKGMSEASLDAIAKAIHRFEESTRFRDFRKFHIEQAIAFHRHLSEATSLATGEPPIKATALQTFNALRAFVLWLAGQPSYRSQIRYSDSDYFRLSEKDTRIAKARTERPVPTIEQVHSVLAIMPQHTDIERRNRALIAFTLLTGVHDGALASLKLKHVDLPGGKVVQNAREVNTKFSKSFTTWFFPAGDDVCEMFEEWVVYLRTQKLWAGDDPCYPQPRSLMVQISSSRLRVSRDAIGLMRRLFVRSFVIRSR